MTGTTGKITLNEGLYNITVEGKMNYIVDEKTVEGQVKGYKESVNLVGTTSADNIKLFLFNSKADFVIEEVYFAGSTTPEGKQYLADQYIKIYNNSDSVLYADGLVILESAFKTSQKIRLHTGCHVTSNGCSKRVCHSRKWERLPDTARMNPS